MKRKAFLASLAGIAAAPFAISMSLPPSPLEDEWANALCEAVKMHGAKMDGRTKNRRSILIGHSGTGPGGEWWSTIRILWPIKGQCSIEIHWKAGLCSASGTFQVFDIIQDNTVRLLSNMACIGSFGTHFFDTTHDA